MPVKQIFYLIALSIGAMACRKPQAPANTSERYTYFKVIARDGLNLREHATVDSKRLLTLPFNTTAEILQMTKGSQKIQGRSGYWLQTKYNDKPGWVFSGFVLVGKTKAELFPEKAQRSAGGVEEIPRATWSEAGQAVSKISFKSHSVMLSNISGVPLKDASDYDLYCGAPPRRLVVQSRNDGFNYIYEPPRGSDGAYNPELMGVKEVMENVIALQEFNGRCSCSGAEWTKLFFITAGGVSAVQQEIHSSPAACSIERNSTFRGVKIDPANRRIYVVEREPKCSNEINSDGSQQLIGLEEANFVVLTLNADRLAREEFKGNAVKAEYQPVFNELDAGK